MGECRGKYYIENGLLKEESCFEDYIKPDGKIIYEVVRVIGGVPLFFEDHAIRLNESVALVNLQPQAPADQLRKHILELCRANKFINGNIKITLQYSESGNRYSLFFIEARYPDSSLYQSGVDTILYMADREIPAAKIFNFSLRSSINDNLVRKGAYEALLVNRDGCITEGSRSNVYFISDQKVITAGDESVLGGITRKYIKQICLESGIEIIYKCMPVDGLNEVDSIFLSGTSPHVLPIRSVDSKIFSVSNQLLRTLYHSYCTIVDSYIREHQ